MAPVSSSKTCIYRIDGNDRLVAVSGNWLDFARGNDAAQSCHPDMVLGRRIWEFIDGPETSHLYEIILTRIRKNGTPIRVPFRCDSPDKRRYLEMEIVPGEEGSIEFYSRIVREEPRDTVELLNPALPRSDEIVKLCSTCRKMELDNHRWVEVEAGIAELRLFDGPTLPQISHGLCKECYDSWMSSLSYLTSST